MHPSVCSSIKLHHHLKHGEYSLFIDNLENLDPNDPFWFRTKMLGLRTLVHQKQVNAALSLSHKWSIGLVDVDQRRHARAEYLYLIWLHEGRKAADLEELETICNQGMALEYGLYWRHLCLRIKAMKLILSLQDANQKYELLDEYGAIIKDYLLIGWKEEAFFCFRDLVDFAITKPLSDHNFAIDYTREFKNLAELSHGSYRYAEWLLIKARLTAEMELQNGSLVTADRIFATAQNEFQDLGNWGGFYNCQVAFGLLLLNYGRPRGLKMLIPAIRFYQKTGDSSRIVIPVSAIISWLKATGNHLEMDTYLDLISNPLIAQAQPNPNRIKISEKDNAIKAHHSLVRAEIALDNGKFQLSEECLKYSLRELKPHGETLLKARALALKALSSMHADEAYNSSAFLVTMGSFVKLGYLSEALDSISQWILTGIQNKELRLLECQMESYLKWFSELNIKAFDVQCAERLGNFHEVLALAFLHLNQPQKSQSHLLIANDIFTGYQMRPRLSFNLMNQAKLKQVLYLKSSRASEIHDGLEVLIEAQSLFKLMKFKSGQEQATSDMMALKTELLSRGKIIDPMMDKSAIDNGPNHPTQIERVSGTLYMYFEDYTFQLLQKAKSKSITQPFNQN